MTLAKIFRVKLKNKRTGKMETRYRVGTKARKFSPLFYTRKAAINFRRKFG